MLFKESVSLPTDQTQDRLLLASIILCALRALICVTLFFLPIYFRHDLGLSGTQIGLLMSLDSLTSLLTTLPVGISNDLVTSRRLAVAAFLSLALVYAALPLSAHFAWLMLVFVAFGLCVGLAQSSLKAMVYKTSGAGGRGQRFSLVAFFEHSGIALGSFVGGLLLASFSFSLLFRVTGLLFVCLAPVALFLPRTATSVFAPASYRKEIFRKDVIFFAMVTFLYTYHWGAEKTCYTLFLKESLGFSQAGIGTLIGVTVIILATASLLYGRMLDVRIASLAKLFVAGLWLSALGNILLALSTTKQQAWLFRSMHEIGDASFVVFSYVMTAALFSKARIGGGAGFVSQLGVAGTLTGSITSGILLEHFGPRLPMIVAGLLTLCALFCLPALRLSDKAPDADPCATQAPVCPPAAEGLIKTGSSQNDECCGRKLL